MNLKSNIIHDIKAIREAAAHNRLVLFVGAGVSANSGVPLWRDLISTLKQPFSSPSDRDTDELKAAQLYLDTYGRKDFLATVRKTLKIDSVSTCQVHKLLLELNPQHIITTNYDTLLEDAASEQLQKFSVIRTDTDIPYCNEANTIVKMHGDFVHGNIVLAEEDYLNYGRNFPLIRTYVQSLFAKNLVLFVGFSFNDINLKFILQDIQSVLQKDMQRAYILTSEEVSHASNLYYEHKGLHVVSITAEDFQRCNFDYPVDSTIKSNHGRQLCRQLALVKNYKEEKSMIKNVVDFLSSIEDQLVPHPDGLRYVIRDAERCSWNLHTTGLQLESEEIKRIKVQIKENKRTAYCNLIRTYGTGLKLLESYARANLIFEVDDIYLIRGVTSEHDMIDSYYESNMYEQAVSMRSELSINDSLSDLEHPYILCLNGRYNEAYAEFKMLAGIYYNHSKYILYFLCLYNIVNMYARVINQKLYEENRFAEEIQREIEKMDLHAILTKLPVTQYVRRILQDILSQELQLSIFSKILKYKNLLTDQRISSERGGFSINSNCALLDACVNRYLLFCHNNYLLCYDDALSRQIYTEYVQGVLESYATIDNKEEGCPIDCSKIKFIGKFHLIMMIFHMEAKELRLCFSRARVDQIEVSADAISYFSQLISNVIDNIHNDYVHPVAEGKRYWGMLENIIFVHTHLVAEQQKQIIFPIVHHLFLNKITIDYNSVRRLFKAQKPTLSECKALLMAYIERLMQYQGENGIIPPLTEVLKEHGEILEKIGNINQFPQNITADDFASCYHVLCPAVQSQILDVINQKISSLVQLVYIHHMGLPVLTIENLGKYLPPDYTDDHNLLHPREFVCSELAKVCKNNKEDALITLIYQYFKDDVCFKFFMNPLDCLQEEAVEPHWILQQTDEIILQYLENNTHRQKIKDYIKTHDFQLGRVMNLCL